MVITELVFSRKVSTMYAAFVQLATVTAGRATRNSYKSPSSDDAAPAQRSESFGPGWPQSAEKAGTSTVGQPDVGAAPGRARTV